MITFFAKFSDTTNPRYMPAEEAIGRIRTGASASLVRDIQRQTDSDARRKLKMQLPCLLFSGKFQRRADSALISHSGLICLDFDEVPFPAEFRDSLKEYEFVYAAFLSPSGTGVKALVRVPPVAGEHRGRFAALKKMFPQADPSGVNESRICYESFDPDAWIRPEGPEFDGYEVPVETPPAPTTGPARSRPRPDYGKLNLCAAMVRNAADGERHNTLLKAAKLAGGYVFAGAFDEETARRVLLEEFSARPYDRSYKPEKTIADGIVHGKQFPIYEQETAPTPKTASQHAFVFASSLSESMLHGFRHGKARGETTHFKTLDPHFTWKTGDFTLFAGRPNSGKSEFVYQLMLVKAVFDGWKWAVFTPENFPADEFYDTLIHAYVGKSVDPHEPNQMSEAEYVKSIEFVDKHFFFLYPDTKHTIEEIERNFEYAIREFGCRGVFIDPYNQLSRTFTERDDQFLDNFLSERKRFALSNGVNYAMSAHPKAMRKNRDTGEYEEVDFYDLAGGAMWGNKIDNFLVVHRPHQSSEPQNPEVEILIRKIKKQKLVGIPGRVCWTFDRHTNRYMQGAIDGTPLVATASDLVAGNEPAPPENIRYAQNFPPITPNF